MVELVGNSIEYITLFEKPFYEEQRTEDMVDKVWREAERERIPDHPPDQEIEAHVSRESGTCVGNGN